MEIHIEMDFTIFGDKSLVNHKIENPEKNHINGKQNLSKNKMDFVEFNCEQTSCVYIHSEGIKSLWKGFHSPLMVNE